MSETLKLLDEVSSGLESIKAKFEEAIEEAYQRGFTDGVATTPDHKEFQKRHKEPQYYGEDGEIVVVSGNLTHTGACRKIYKLLKQDIDITYAEVEEQTNHAKILLGQSNQENDYYYDRSAEGIFDAWVWTA